MIGPEAAEMTLRHTQTGAPSATSADEAVWRAVARISSAAGWLQLDLAPLAEAQQSQSIMEGLAELIKMLGQTLLPQLGQKLLQASRPPDQKPRTLSMF